MKKILFIASIAIISMVFYSFTVSKSEVKPKPVTTYFYQYTSSSTAQADIQNISNYQRASESCSGGTNVCGVYLSSDRPLGQHPVSAEFDAAKSDLWDSQSAGSSVNPDAIKMKN